MAPTTSSATRASAPGHFVSARTQCPRCTFANPIVRRCCARCLAPLRGEDQSARATFAGPTPLIGQAHAAAAIVSTIDRAFTVGAPSVAFVAGAEGSGKSRLLEHAAEFGARAAERVTLLEAHHPGARDANPYEPFAAMLLERAGVTTDMPSVAARGRISTVVAEALHTHDAVVVSETTHLIGHVTGVEFPDSPFLLALADRPHELRRRATDAVQRFFAGASQVDPVLVLIDDADRMQDAAWMILRALASGDGHMAFVLSGSPAAAARMERLVPEGRLVSTRLLPMTEPDVAALLRVLLPELDHAPEPLVSALVYRTQGSPRILTALIPTLLDRGLFRRHEGGLVADLSKLASDSFPVTLDDAIAARLARLSREERAVLDRAAVVGQVFWDAALVSAARWEHAANGSVASLTGEDLVLAASSDADRRAVGRALAELEAKGLVVELPSAALPGATAYAFQLPRMRDVIYAAIDENTKVARHTAAAGWLALTAELRREGIAALIAPHLEEAGWLHRAGRAYFEAAAYERARLHTHAALHFIEKAIPLIPEEDVVRRLDALHEQGSLLTTLGRYDDALAAFEQMLALAFRIGARAKSAAAMNRIGRLHRERGEEDRAELVFSRALELFRSVGDLRGVAATLDDMAQAMRLRGKPQKALPLALEALELRRAHADARGTAVSLHTLGAIEFSRGRMDAAELYFSEALEIRESIGDRLGVMQCHNALAALAYEDGKPDAAAVAWRAAIVRARELGARRELCFMLNNLGEAAMRLGAQDEARASLDEALDLAESLGDKRALAEISRNRAIAAFLGAELDANARMEEALRLAEEFGGREAIAHALRSLAQARAQHGDADGRAEREFVASIELFRVLGNEREVARSIAALGHHLAEREEHARASARLREARSMMERLGLPGLEQVDATLRVIATTA